MVFILVMIIACTKSDHVRFSAVGDTPYFDSDVELEFLVESFEDMEKNSIPFVVHIGDIFSGRTNCSIELYEVRSSVFSKSPIPFLITVGDNEYSDCRDSTDAQHLFRTIILKTPPLQQSISGLNKKVKPVVVTRQKEMIENAVWNYKNIMFAMLVLPDLPGDYPLSPNTISTIFRANISFMQKNFTDAIRNNRDSMVLFMHSNPVGCIVEGCEEFRNSLLEGIIKFGKPVMLINGSVHSREFIDGGFLEIPHLSHLRPGDEPEVSWPEIIFSTEKNKFLVKWHEAKESY